MQIARQIGAFLILQGAQLLFQAKVARLHDAQPFGHLVDASAEAHEFGRPLLAYARLIVARTDAAKSGREMRQGPQGAPGGQPDEQRAGRQRGGQDRRQVDELRPHRADVIGEHRLEDQIAVAAQGCRHPHSRNGKPERGGEPGRRPSGVQRSRPQDLSPSGVMEDRREVPIAIEGEHEAAQVPRRVARGRQVLQGVGDSVSAAHERRAKLLAQGQTSLPSGHSDAGHRT